MKSLCKDKIAIIIHCTDEQYQEECINYVELLEIPDKYKVDLFVVAGDSHKSAAYNEAMNASDAKYKLYLSQTTFVLQKDCITQCIDLFEENDKLGMLGILGGRGKQQLGKAIVSNAEGTELLDYQKGKDKYNIVDRLDEAFIFTQYDIPWSEDISEHARLCGDKGYYAAVPYQDIAWCQVDRKTEFEGTTEAQQIYNYIKFMLRRIQFQFPAEMTQAFYEDYKEGYISKQIVTGILEREILYKKRVEHMIAVARNEFQYGSVNGALGTEMNIMTSLNRNYVGPACVMLESVYQNHPEMRINVYMLHSELTDDDMKIIEKHGLKWGAQISFLKIDRKIFEKMPTTDLWSLEAFYRLAMNDILPADIDRMLYLDVDIAVLHPLHEFYFADFEGNDLIACKDMGSTIPFGDKRDSIFAEWVKQDEFVYCCSGVTLWNVAKLRETTNLKTYLEVAENLGYDLLAPDQDLINLVHAGRIKVVDEYKYDCFVKGCKWTADEVKRYVSILHYAGATKPWSGKYPKVDSYKVWWEYAKNTPLYVEMLEKVFEESYETDKMLYENLKRLTKED